MCVFMYSWVPSFPHKRLLTQLFFMDDSAVHPDHKSAQKRQVCSYFGITYVHLKTFHLNQNTQLLP